MTRSLMITVAALALLTGCSPATPTPGTSADKQPPLSDKEVNYLRMATATEKGGDTTVAEDLYRKAIKESSGNISSHIKLARLLRDTQRTPEALEVLQQAQKLQPNNTIMLKELGNTYIGLDKPEEALPVFDQALKGSANDPRLYSGKGVALDMLGRHDEAQKAYRSGIRINPAESDYIENNLALSYLFSGKYDEAIPLLERLNKSKSATATTRQNLALAYGLNGDMEKARIAAGKDISADELENNLAFYQHYRQQKLSKGGAVSAVPAPAVEATPLPEPQTSANTGEQQQGAEFITSARFQTKDEKEQASPAEAPARVTEAPAEETPVAEETQETPKVFKEVKTPEPVENEAVSVKPSNPGNIAPAESEEPAATAEEKKFPVAAKKARPAAREPKITVAPDDQAAPEEGAPSSGESEAAEPQPEPAKKPVKHHPFPSSAPEIRRSAPSDL